MTNEFPKIMGPANHHDQGEQMPKRLHLMPKTQVHTPRMTIRTPAAITPIAFVSAIMEGYSRRGQSPDVALAVAQISARQILQPDARITAAQMEIISDHAMRELDDEALGWFDRRLPWGSYGMLARASLSAPTLGVAMKRWCRHHGLLTSDIALQLLIEDETAELALQEQRDFGPLREFCQVSLMRNFIGVASWLIDSRIPVQAAAFAWASPPHADVYATLFPAPASFGAPMTRLQMDARYFALPLRRDDKALNQMLQHPLPLMVQPYRRDRLLLDRARRLLHTPENLTDNAQALANKLHVSVRTLHRQLQEQGHSLQNLKNEARRNQATDLLMRTRQPIKQVALAAGFLNEKSFTRAFKGWTGLTPAAFRASQGLTGAQRSGG